MTAASGADQPTLREQLDVLDGIAAVLHQHCGPEVCVCVDDARELLPVIEADRERAKAEGGAEALEKLVTGGEELGATSVPLWHIENVAVALRGSTGGGT